MPKSKMRKKPIISKSELLELKKQTIEIIVLASILSINDSYKKVSTEKIKTFVNKTKMNLIAMRDGVINIKDLREVLIEEHNLDIKKIFELEDI